MKRQSPSRFFLRFFRWYCHPAMRDYIEGDLMEVYERRLKSSGYRSANIRFIADVLLLFRPGIIRPIEGYGHLNVYGMYKNYFKTGLRNLLRNKSYSAINIGGLAIGMAVAILNGLWVWHELSHNKYFGNYDRIAAVAERGLDPEHGGHWIGTTITYPLSSELSDNYRQHFKRIARMSWEVDCIMSSGDNMMSVMGAYAGEELPEIFSFKMLKGSRDALKRTHSILISSSFATVMFGDEDPINKTIRMNNRSDVTVGGVFEDFPLNTAFYEKRFFAPWGLYVAENKWIEDAMNDRRNHFIKTYVEIPEGASFENVTAQVKGALKFDPLDVEDAKKHQRELYLYPMSRWHLYPTNHRTNQDPKQLIILVGAIGVFVLILACINFMNLSTARSEKRAKEIGIRKTIGSVRGQLISQFFVEAFVIVSFSFVIALMLTALFLPQFNSIATKNITMPWTNGVFWLSAIGFVLLTSFMAGSYPALYLSSFNPVRALKGSFRVGRLAATPRKVLVVFQFSISIILIVGTIVVYQQIQYAKNRPVGYDRNGLIALRKKSRDFYGKFDVLRNELKKTGVVQEVSESMGPVTAMSSNNGGFDWEGKDPNVDQSFGTLAVTRTHGRTVGWKFLAGRDFDVDDVADSTGIVINETAAKIMAFKDPVGQPVHWTVWYDGKKFDYKIIGVIEDMVMTSPYDPIMPVIFFVKGHARPDWINIRVNPAVSMIDALPKIEAVFKKVVPSAPFDYKFMDDEYSLKFAKEERIGNLAAVFSVLAILISCLGLFGLASFVTEQKTKEIGIRKVLGASLTHLCGMLSREFIMLVSISLLLGSPLAFYLFKRWLEKFAYHTTMSPWMIALTCAVTLLVTLATVSFQTVRASLMNPVKSLKSE